MLAGTIPCRRRRPAFLPNSVLAWTSRRTSAIALLPSPVDFAATTVSSPSKARQRADVFTAVSGPPDPAGPSQAQTLGAGAAQLLHKADGATAGHTAAPCHLCFGGNRCGCACRSLDAQRPCRAVPPARRVVLTLQRPHVGACSSARARARRRRAARPAGR